MFAAVVIRKGIAGRLPGHVLFFILQCPSPPRPWMFLQVFLD